MRVPNVIALPIAILIPLAVGSIGGLITFEAIPTWYRELVRPAWNPPDWVFGPVWTALYIMMGLSTWLVWRMGWHVPRVRLALGMFALQLGLNFLWSVIFFGLKEIGLAFFDIIVLLVVIAITGLRFLSLEPLAGVLMFPYFMWVTFAAFLNAAIWWLNR
ncbi:MAG TPA: TspO/MBR family protein [Anaerolineales bacterium]|nr:TspO/MBR family protein [Anaerolineales bacterium]